MFFTSPHKKFRLWRPFFSLAAISALKCSRGTGEPRCPVRAVSMAAIVLTLAASALVAGPTLAVKVRAACEQLGIAESGLTVPAALKACNAALGIEASGPLLAQADELVHQLGISVGTLVPQPAPAAPEAAPPIAVPPIADLATLDARVAAALLPPPPPRPREQPAMPKLVVFDLGG